jgi:DNA primase
VSRLDFSILDIPAEVERHTSTRLHPTSRSGKQFSGACPYDDCSVDTDGFTVWQELTDRGRHYYCRGCRRSGDIVRLIRDIKGFTFKQACEELGLTSPYVPGTGNQTTLPAASTKRNTPAPSQDCLILRELYPRARLALNQPRVKAYLAQRGIPYALACELGLAYIPPFDLATDARRALDGWQDRIVFPLTSRQGQGFTGRALALWEPGMDENEHKRLLDEQKILRYKSTYPAGYFHALVLETCDHVTFVEGAFDAAALIAGGILEVLATCGTSLDVAAIPVRICDATLAYDGDEEGQKAAEQVRRVLRSVGITPKVCTPPQDELGTDWSERYRLHGRAGIAALIAVFASEIARAGCELEQLRHEIGELVRAEEEQWELSDELDPAWPPSAGVRKRLRRKAVTA